MCVEVFSVSPDSFLFVFEFGKVAEHSNAIPKELGTLVGFLSHIFGKVYSTSRREVCGNY